jgi:hypothetical protein
MSIDPIAVLRRCDVVLPNQQPDLPDRRVVTHWRTRDGRVLDIDLMGQQSRLHIMHVVHLPRASPPQPLLLFMYSATPRMGVRLGF